MIDIKALKESDKGRKVVYNPFPNVRWSRPDFGKLVSWNKNYILVKYDNIIDGRPRETNPEDLYFVTSSNPVTNQLALNL